MPARKRQQPAAAAAAGGPAAKAARGGGAASAAAVLAQGWESALLPRQPTGRVNACWAPPVVAIARFCGITELPAASLSHRGWPAGAGCREITVESVLALRPGDDEDEVCEVLEDIVGWWLPHTTFGNDEAFITTLCPGRASEIVYGGPTSVADFGVQSVADGWWAALARTLSGSGDDEQPSLVLLLVERLEGGKDKGNTHYLLVLGYEEQARRRGGNVRKLWLKDPMVSREQPSLAFHAARS